MKMYSHHSLQKQNLLNLMLAMFFLALISMGLSGNVAASSNVEPNDKEVVIVNSENSNAAITLNQARAIFSLRARTWPDGSRITVLVLKDRNPTHISFLQSTLKILPHQLRRHWDRYIYSGIGQGPVVVDNQQEMVEMVNKIPGAIGYIAKGVPHAQVLTLTVH